MPKSLTRAQQCHRMGKLNRYVETTGLQAQSHEEQHTGTAAVTVSSCTDAALPYQALYKADCICCKCLYF